jgi:hypothetical protein
MSVTRRQHYVWRHYLSAWETDGTVAVSRTSGSSFRTPSANLAVERDFYRIPELSDADIRYLERFVTTLITDTSLHGMAFDWVNLFAAPSLLRRIVNQRAAEFKADVLAEIEKLEIQTEESVHSQLEGDAVPILAALRSGEQNPWSADADALTFAIYISFQHMRTKKMRDNVLAKMESHQQRELMARTYPVIRAILATNLGWTLYADRKSWKLRRLIASQNLQFITSDQPSWNMIEPRGDNDLAIYYPVSPTVAILFENINNTSVVPDDELEDKSVARLNRLMVDQSHEQIFGADLAYLATLR